MQELAIDGVYIGDVHFTHVNLDMRQYKKSHIIDELHDNMKCTLFFDEPAGGIPTDGNRSGAVGKWEKSKGTFRKYRTGTNNIAEWNALIEG